MDAHKSVTDRDEKLLSLWVRLPSPPKTILDQVGLNWDAAQKLGGLRYARVTYGDGEFHADPDGRPAILIGCWIDPPSLWREVAHPVLLDIVACDPQKSALWGCRYNTAGYLGHTVLDEARFFGKHLPVYKTPLAWLKARGAGVVPIEIKEFAFALLGVPEITIVCENIAHALEVKEAVDSLRDFGYPRIGALKNGR